MGRPATASTGMAAMATLHGFRTLGSGNAAFRVSAMGFGCMGLNHHRSQHPDEKTCIRLVHEAIERGVTLFDTAESYGYHANEILTGKALKGYADRVFATTKFGHKFVNGVQVRTEEDSTPANIRRVCENSLRNLGVETLGIFYQHRIDPGTPIEVVAETVGELIKEGKVLHFGLCEVNAETIRRAHAVCPVTAIQSEYHFMHRTVEQNGVLALCEELGIGFVPYSPLNRGFLGGMINEYTQFDPTNDNPPDAAAFSARSHPAEHAHRGSAQRFRQNEGHHPGAGRSGMAAEQETFYRSHSRHDETFAPRREPEGVRYSFCSRDGERA